MVNCSIAMSKIQFQINIKMTCTPKCLNFQIINLSITGTINLELNIYYDKLSFAVVTFTARFSKDKAAFNIVILVLTHVVFLALKKLVSN
jgi:hypothetical protein